MIELTVLHDGRNWVASGDDISAAAPTLEELDREVGRLAREAGRVGERETLKVHMAFDYSTIPQWIRQYSQHYFNRIVTIRG